ncbi:Brix domain [Lasallia pustulata]|uniref:Brix domain n=1 Tax=Lasallia pustulata TaxID=136370 RepID=A0A1W5D9F2_9LECA|nr:Brix domain [Lasallia pustulata]
MARRRVKKRTHVGARNGPTNAVSANTAASRIPKSMVIRIGAGEVGPSVSQLVKDVRHMMEPGTASRLKERRSNRLRDYTTMAGPLGVSHLLLFSRSTSGNTNLRLAITPRGPTLHFRIEKYSLCKDIQKSQKHPKAGGKEYLSPPLLVMNNFTTPQPPENSPPQPVPKHLESLTTSIFQSLFPPISPQTTPLTSIRRVLLLDRDLPSSPSPTHPPHPSSQPDEPASYTLNLRHYAISTKRTGLSRSLRRLHAAETHLRHPRTKHALPNLHHLPDISDYLLDPSGGFTSGSDTDAASDAEVEVLAPAARKVLSKKQLERVRAADGARGGKIKAGKAEAEKRARTKIRKTPSRLQ